MVRELPGIDIRVVATAPTADGLEPPMIAVVVALAALAAVLAAALVCRSGSAAAGRSAGASRRILVPFTGGTLDPTVLDAAIRIAHAEDATLVPAYLLLVPLEYSEDSPLTTRSRSRCRCSRRSSMQRCRAGVPVDARIEKGRTPTHALQRLWDVEQFDRDRRAGARTATAGGGFTAKDLTWILAHAPTETLVLKPSPNGVQYAA